MIGQKGFEERIELGRILARDDESAGGESVFEGIARRTPCLSLRLAENRGLIPLPFLKAGAGGVSGAGAVDFGSSLRNDARFSIWRGSEFLRNEANFGSRSQSGCSFIWPRRQR